MREETSQATASIATLEETRATHRAMLESVRDQYRQELTCFRDRFVNYIHELFEDESLDPVMVSAATEIEANSDMVDVVAAMLADSSNDLRDLATLPAGEMVQQFAAVKRKHGDAMRRFRGSSVLIYLLRHTSNFRSFLSLFIFY